MKLEPINTLRNPSTPKVGDIVNFRPSEFKLDDVEYWRRYTSPSRWFGMVPEERRMLVGKIKSIKRRDDGWHYWITSRTMGFNVSFEDVDGLHKDWD